MNEWEWQLLEEKHPVEHLEIAGAQVTVGDRVRLRPNAGGDVLDIALAGQCATIEAIEQDYEGKCHVSVVMDDDPGRDLGMLRQPGHRFFFTPSEIEPLPPSEQRPKLARPSILIAGIGNIFQGDDAFGVEVANRLLCRELPYEARVIDFGIRGLDLAYALQDGYETVILVDAFRNGLAPGTVSIVEPALDEAAKPQPEDAMVESHGMHPVRVLRLALAMGARLKRVLLVACEPENLGGEEGAMGLSAPVERAAEQAVERIESLLTQILEGTWPRVSGEKTAS
jgi:hydrogenase maturation protease